MSGKKTRKTNKRKPSPSKNSFSLVQQIEKDLLSAPAQLIAQLTKEAASYKQKETKLKISLNKVKGQLAQIQKRIDAFTKSNTAASKKQLKTAKKTLTTLIASQKTLNKELQDTTKSIELTNTKIAKMNALRKQLSQFEKDWTKKARALKTKTISKPKAKRTVKKTKAPIISIIENPKNDLIESIFSNEQVVSDENKEAVS
ncbi:MAG: hypothetical protein ACD_46C00014G0003 [uncultured bacterium]|nr:MAG: hypothetical protein ACD_46C00014G0003 [uncultured bacterium]